jgi:hypothetical protein
MGIGMLITSTEIGRQKRKIPQKVEDSENGGKYE